MYRLSGYGVDFPSLDQLNGYKRYQDRGANDAVHKEALQPKHFLYPEPGNDFRFGKNDPKQNS